MEDAESLVKIYVDLPNHPEFGSESMWAKAIEPDHYEIRNSPFHAYGLNFKDIVMAVPDAEGQKPAIKSIVRNGGHTTLRVIFLPGLIYEERIKLLKKLNEYKCFFEGANNSYFALDVEPDGSLEQVRANLDEWESRNILSYETCEQKVEGHFGPAPDEGEGSESSKADKE